MTTNSTSKLIPQVSNRVEVLSSSPLPGSGRTGSGPTCIVTDCHWLHVCCKFWTVWAEIWLADRRKDLNSKSVEDNLRADGRRRLFSLGVVLLGHQRLVFGCDVVFSLEKKHSKQRCCLVLMLRSHQAQKSASMKVSPNTHVRTFPD